MFHLTVNVHLKKTLLNRIDIFNKTNYHCTIYFIRKMYKIKRKASIIRRKTGKPFLQLTTRNKSRPRVLLPMFPGLPPIQIFLIDNMENIPFNKWQASFLARNEVVDSRVIAEMGFDSQATFSGWNAFFSRYKLECDWAFTTLL